MNDHKKIVLVVDDSLLIMERIIPLLEESAKVEFVIHAGTYKEATEVLDHMKPDLLLLDIHLPDKSGIKLLEMVRTQYSSIVVFIMTNHPSDQYRTTCERLGASRFFDKSTEFDRISEAIPA